METVFHKKLISFEAECLYDRAQKIVFFTFTGTFNVDLIIECDRTMMKFIEKNAADAVCVNLLNAKGSFSSMNKFAAEELNPHMIKYGVKHVAVVSSSDIFTRFATNAILKVMIKMDMKMFSQPAAAKKWLEEKLGKAISLDRALEEAI